MKTIIINTENTEITIDGKKYILIPDDVPAPKESELKTFEDCWNKIKPKWFLNSSNRICEASDPTFNNLTNNSANQLPTEKSAKQIQATIKLHVVSHALQGEYVHYGNQKNYNYVVLLNNKRELDVMQAFNVYSPFSFKDEETARKSIEIAKDIWLEYFGVK